MDDDCKKWRLNKNINPITNRKIKTNGTVYMKLSRICGNDNYNGNGNDNGNDNDNCKRWLLNKNINPITNRKIKDNGPVYNMFNKLCNKKKENKKEEDIMKEKEKAGEKILQIFKPLAKRVSANIIDRINYYIIVRKYIDYIKKNYKNNCIHTYKSINNEKLLSVGKNIILDKKLGTGGFGVVYKAYFRPNDIKYKKLGKMFKMVVKICEITDKNKKEIDIANKLTALVLKMVCPHFPISYGYLTCNKNNEPNYSKISSAVSSSISNSSSSNIHPDFFSFKNKPKLYLIVNEYANNAFPFMIEYIFRKYNLIIASSILNNMIIQIFISMIFFQHYTKLVHNDTHGFNFLVHYIKDGGYYHYNIYGKDYYLKNTGYLIVINDFGLVKSINQKPIKTDFVIFINFFERIIKKYKNFISMDIIYFLRNISLNRSDLYNHLFYFMNKCFPQNLITSKPSNIINKTPFIIS